MAGGGNPTAHQAAAVVAVALHSIAVEAHLRRRLAVVNAIGGGAVVAAVELSAHHLPGLGGIGHQHRGQQGSVRVLKSDTTVRNSISCVTQSWKESRCCPESDLQYNIIKETRQ